MPPSGLSGLLVITYYHNLTVLPYMEGNVATLIISIRSSKTKSMLMSY